MEKSNYLPIGHKVGGHYEIVKVLGEDDFEILYLAKDLHLLEKPFVLKELFLKAYSSRENVNVYTLAKSKSLFEETKQEVIAEISVLQKEASPRVAQVYGYFEENNTVYTIVEFREEDTVYNYLHLNPIEEDEQKVEEKSHTVPSKEPMAFEKSPEKPIKEEQKKKKSTIFLKILIVVSLLLLALAYYSYNMIQEDKERIKNRDKLSVVQESVAHHPPLEDKQEQKREESKDESIEEKKETPPVRERAKVEEQKIKSIADLVDLSDIPKEELEMEEDEFETLDENTTLGTLIVGDESNQNIFTREVIQDFLNNFLASSSSGTIDDVVANYDTKVDRYFRLNNITPTTIRKDKVRYQKKWTHRDFALANFEISNIYHKDGFDYCDVKTTTYWNVATDSYKTASGTSKGFMTLKNTDNGFKVTSIYTLK